MVIRDDHMKRALRKPLAEVAAAEFKAKCLYGWMKGLAPIHGDITKPEGRLERLEVILLDTCALLWAINGVQIAAVTPEIAVRASFLPGELHADPADRLLIATAILLGLRFVTRDREILRYASRGHLSALRC